MLHLLINNTRLQQFTHNDVNFCVVPESGDFEVEVVLDHMHHLSMHTCRREVVVSVDGLDVMDGKAASTQKRGYVVTESTLRVPGWRIDGGHVAKFKLGGVSSSYAAQMAQDVANVGVVGVAIWSEQRRAEISAPVFRGGVARCGNIGGTAMLSVGTSFGDRADFATTSTEFKRASSAPTTHTLYYRTRQWFTDNGIPVPISVGALGNAFPGDSVGCILPPGYRG